MTCYRPITLYKSRQGPDRKTGKWALGSLKNGYIDMPQDVSCGYCIGCRLEKSRQWAVRCVHELKYHEKSCFITLTSKDENLNWGINLPTLYPRELQLFWKRLRKKYGDNIRYFACGEYGERFNRPHYHAILFGHDFGDKLLYSSKDGINIYISAELDTVWGNGKCVIGDANFQTAAYVARYIMDKKIGKSSDYYKINGLEPEFIRMSRGGRNSKGKPGGIGSKWLENYSKDVYPDDFVIIDNKKIKPPKYYDRKYELDNPIQMRYIKERRKLDSYDKWRENTPSRLLVRETVKKAQIKSLSR